MRKRAEKLPQMPRMNADEQIRSALISVNQRFFTPDETPLPAANGLTRRVPYGCDAG